MIPFLALRLTASRRMSTDEASSWLRIRNEFENRSLGADSGRDRNSDNSSGPKSSAESTVRFYDVLSVVFFVLAIISLSMLTLYLITDFIVLALGAMDIGTILNAVSRMISIRTIPDSNERRVKAANTVKFFHIVSYACFGIAAIVFAIALNDLATDFAVMGLELTGCGTILRAVSRDIQLEGV